MKVGFKGVNIIQVCFRDDLLRMSDHTTVLYDKKKCLFFLFVFLLLLACRSYDGN